MLGINCECVHFDSTVLTSCKEQRKQFPSSVDWGFLKSRTGAARKMQTVLNTNVIA